MTEFKVERVGCPSGAIAELATLKHGGKEYTAFGSTIDIVGGHIVAYVRTGHRHLENTYFDLITFEGSHIAVLEKRGESRGFYGSRITHFAMTFSGHRWHGKLGLDWSQLIHMRRGKKL